MGTSLTLGPVAFTAFEVPERISFGGTQRLAIHRLAGGGRVVDSLGWDDAPITWSGTFSGNQAGSRARLLETICAAGNPVSLMWDDFCYTVVIARFSADYRFGYWIPYRIECAVTRDQLQQLAIAAEALMNSELADLTSAAAFGIDLTAAVSAVSASGATVIGTIPYSQAQTALSSAQSQIITGLQNAGNQITSPNFTTALTASGQLANLSAAFGYVARASVNLSNAST